MLMSSPSCSILLIRLKHLLSFSVITIFYIYILEDPGADSRARESRNGQKTVRKKSRTSEELLSLALFQSSSAIFFFWPVPTFTSPTICPWVSEDVL